MQLLQSNKVSDFLNSKQSNSEYGTVKQQIQTEGSNDSLEQTYGSCDDCHVVVYAMSC